MMKIESEIERRSERVVVGGGSLRARGLGSVCDHMITFVS